MTRPGGRIVMGNWIPGDPTLVAQILKISSAYSPPPPEGFVSPMTWGVEDNVVERFAAAGVRREQDLVRARHLHVRPPGPPSELLAVLPDLLRADDERLRRRPTANGREAELQAELGRPVRGAEPERRRRTSIPATYLRVTVTR